MQSGCMLLCVGGFVTMTAWLGFAVETLLPLVHQAVAAQEPHSEHERHAAAEHHKHAAHKQPAAPATVAAS